MSGDFSVQLVTGITSGNRACRTCRRGSSRGYRCRCRGMRAYVLGFSLQQRTEVREIYTQTPRNQQRHRAKKKSHFVVLLRHNIQFTVTEQGNDELHTLPQAPVARRSCLFYSLSPSRRLGPVSYTHPEPTRPY